MRMDKQKAIPPATPEWVLPPIENYTYFEHHEEHPFDHEATGFKLVNAWWLADAALLAYADGPFAKEKFEAAGLTVDGQQPVSGQSTQCYVAHNENFVIVAFRGTQVFKPGPEETVADQLRAVVNRVFWVRGIPEEVLGVGRTFFERLKSVLGDVVTDARFGLVQWEGGGNVHDGFRDALEEVWGVLEGHLNALANGRVNRTVWFTGHSLGAALATLAAIRFGKARGLYTFGSPRVGDAEFAGSYPFHNTTYRFVNNQDIVTTVPPFGPRGRLTLPLVRYEHVGQVKYISTEKAILDELPERHGAADVAGNPPPSQIEMFLEGINGLIRNASIQSLNDHGPIYYTLHIWNEFERSM
jgi:triacylglycerol lipase